MMQGEMEQTQVILERQKWENISLNIQRCQTIRTFIEPSRQWFPACKLNELPRQKSHSAGDGEVHCFSALMMLTNNLHNLYQFSVSS